MLNHNSESYFASQMKLSKAMYYHKQQPW